MKCLISGFLYFSMFFILIMAVEFLDSLLASRMIFQRSCSSSRSLFEGCLLLAMLPTSFVRKSDQVQVSNVFVFDLALWRRFRKSICSASESGLHRANVIIGTCCPINNSKISSDFFVSVS